MNIELDRVDLAELRPFTATVVVRRDEHGVPRLETLHPYVISRRDFPGGHEYRVARRPTRPIRP